MSYGYGGEYHRDVNTSYIAKDTAREARNHYRTILDGGRIMVWRGDSVIAQLDRDGEYFRLAASDGALHKLKIVLTDGDRLAAHVEGFVEIKLADYGHPVSGVHFSLIY